MSFVPVIKQIYPDELLYSWIHRIADANGLRIKDFSNAYLGTNNAAIGSLPFDIKNEFVHLYKYLLKKPNMIDFYLSTSTAEFEAMFMTEGQQTKLVNNIFAPKNSLNTSSNGLIQSVNICPECMKEDIDIYGEAYLHRHHQMSNVATCHIHHCPLRSYIGKKGHACDYNLSDYEEIKTDIALNSLNAYTDYASSFFNVLIPCNIKVLKDVLYKQLKSEGYSAYDAYKSFIDNIEKWKYRDLISFDIERFLKVKMISAEYVSQKELLPILMYLYPNPNDVLDEIRSRNIAPLMKEYKCPNCEKKYVTTPYAFSHHFGCHNCNENLSEHEIVSKIFSNSGYQLKSEFKSLAKKVSLYHDDCGQTISITPRAFLYEGARCLCESTITFKKAKEMVELSGEYDLTEFSSSEGLCKIHSKSCGHTFEVRYRKFIKSPQCRVCFPKNMTTAYLAERIKNTTNGEYELIGEFIEQNTKIKILHHKCGQITEYTPRYYHMGAICPICNNRFSDKWEEMFNLLCEYKNEFGTAYVHKRDNYREQNLGLWCQKQRKRKKIPDYQKQKLIDIGFSFDPLEDEWNRRFEQYQRYAEEKGSPNIFKRTDYEGEHLGAWIVTQQQRYRAGKMSQTRIDKLLSVNKSIFLINNNAQESNKTE